MIALPPLSAGAVQLTTTCVFPDTPVTAVGAPGVVNGVTAVDTTEYDPVPPALTAATLNTYEVPLVSPVTVAEVDVLVPSLKVVHEEPLFDEY